jgi:hypothetical protein
MTSEIQSVFFAQSEGGTAEALAMLIGLAVGLISIIGVWKVFAKAGQPGWAIFIPIYQTIVIIQVAKRPIWWIVLMFIPIVNLIVTLIIMIDVAKNFGKGTGYGLGLLFLPFIFFPLLGFGDDQYQA